MKVTHFLIAALLTMFSSNVRGDYYTSIVSLIDLLEAEMQVIGFLEQYMEAMEEISRKANETLSELAYASQEADEDPEEYYENPLNAYKIISRFVIDWKKLNETVFDGTHAAAYTANLTELDSKEGYTAPTQEDLKGASKGLARLQRTYQLATIDVAEGDLKEMNYGQNFSTSECYWLGRSLYEAGDFKYASEWLIQARIRLAEELRASNDVPEFKEIITDVQVLELLAAALFYLGKSNLASFFNDEILAQEPTNENALKNQLLYLNKAHAERNAVRVVDEANNYLQRTELDELFDQTCNGDRQQTPREKRNLRCRYVHNNVPFCRLAPFKKEELSHDPPIAYYHETIYDNEMARIINATEHMVERSMVGDSKQSGYSEVRTSQNTWLNLTENAFLHKIAQRLRDVTGLSLESGESLQVANYGIGGHYGAHYDFSEEDDPDEDYDGQGNRLLTALFYINEVELGGGTAFPYLRLLAPPIRGSMIVWYNLHKSLELDYRTKHGGCPVLVGSKWICNEWFHIVGQEFNRPCGLEQDGYKSLPWKGLH